MTRLLPAIAAVSMLACNHADFRERATRHYRESVTGQDAKEVKTILKLGAGELRLTGGGAQLLEADIRTSGDRPKIRYDGGSQARLEIGQETSLHLGDNENDWDLKLSEKIPLDLEIHLGAGEARLDLDNVVLRSLVVHMGAGELNLDVRGNYTSDVDIEVHGGVGEAKIRLPKHMQIDAEVHGGLGDIETHGLEQDGDHHYTAPGRTAGPKMTMEIHGGIGHIELNRQAAP